MAVSYTHLDVYKRQASHTGRLYNPAESSDIWHFGLIQEQFVNILLHHDYLSDTGNTGSIWSGQVQNQGKESDCIPVSGISDASSDFYSDTKLYYI